MTRRGRIGSALLLVMLVGAASGLGAWKQASIREANAASASHPEMSETVTVAEARLYGADETVYGGLNAFFLLMDEPEKYQLPNAANAVLPSRNNVRGYLTTAVTAATQSTIGTK